MVWLVFPFWQWYDCAMVPGDLSQTWLPTPDHRHVLEHLACCAPDPVPMDFLERFCEEPRLQTMLEDLSARSNFAFSR